MPCYDGPRDTRHEREIAELTEMLCEAGRIMRHAGVMEGASQRLQTWVRLHEIRDEEKALAARLAELKRGAK